MEEMVATDCETVKRARKRTKQQQDRTGGDEMPLMTKKPLIDAPRMCPSSKGRKAAKGKRGKGRKRPKRKRMQR
jgi:hypothetical protein